MSEQSTRWRRVVDLMKDLGEFAKFGVLCLGAFGLIALYFPAARRVLEAKVVGIDSYYNVGLLTNPPQFGSFRPRRIYSPAWDGGLQSLERLFDLRDQVVFTQGGDDTVGREWPSERAMVRNVYPASTCLYVSDVFFRPYRRATPPGTEKEIRTGIGWTSDDLWAQPLSKIRERAVSEKKSVASAFLASLPPEIRMVETACRQSPEQTDKPLCPRISVWIKARKVTC